MANDALFDTDANGCAHKFGRLMDLLEQQDQKLREHALRVAQLSMSLSLAMRPNDFDLSAHVAVGGLVHDVGKTGIPTLILDKPGELDHHELNKMRKHAVMGERLLRTLIEEHEVLRIVRSHHERWNGSGYPDGTRGVNLPLGVRIVSVADAFDALTSDRSYHQGVTVNNALNYFRHTAGTLWDPEVVKALFLIHNTCE